MSPKNQAKKKKKKEDKAKYRVFKRKEELKILEKYNKITGTTGF